VATDVDLECLERARIGCYPRSSLKDLPEELAQRAFTQTGGLYRIREIFVENVEFARQDIREHLPDELFHLIFCRNLVFTYFEESLQVETLRRIAEKLLPGGFLVLGRHESLPRDVTTIRACGSGPEVFRKATC
jgi:chemotaxis protein methyltransferase CheR